jgi:hypothetical protein
VVTGARAIIVRNPLTIVGGVVTLISLSIFAVYVLGDGLEPGQKNMAMITILGLVANAIPSLLSLLKSESTQHDVRNGVVKQKVKDAIEEMAADPEIESVSIEHVETKEGESNG